MDYTKEFKELLATVDNEMGRDQDSLYFLEWVIDEHYRKTVRDNEDYFKKRPDLLAINNERVLYELNLMLNYFIEKEEYEKCARIKVIKQGIIQNLDEIWCQNCSKPGILIWDEGIYRCPNCGMPA